MRRGIVFFLILSIFSCSKFVEKPKVLVSEEKMAEILVELALNDQAPLTKAKMPNVEAGTRYILKKNNVSAKEFSDSYQYYAITKKLSKILENAQEILLERYPETEAYILKKNKENNNTPTLKK